MRLISTLPLLCATLATSSVLPSFSSKSQAVVLSDPFTDLSVPGNNPLNFCADPTDYILEIDHVDLSPNPPVPGQTLNISAVGTFREEVGSGAKVFLQVKYGLITLINQEADLCEQVGIVDLTCPLKEEVTLSKSLEIPKQVPKGTYSVMADVRKLGGSPVTCMMSEIVFS